jgi:hypothetical protein
VERKVAKGRKYDKISFHNRKKFFFLCTSEIVFNFRCDGNDVERERERERERAVMSSHKAIISVRYNVYVPVPVAARSKA